MATLHDGLDVWQERKREAWAAFRKYDERLRADYAPAALKEERGQNPLMPVIYADGFLEAQGRVAQAAYDSIGAAMLSTTPEGDYVLEKAGLETLLGYLRERGAK